MHADFRRCLLELDVTGIRALCVVTGQSQPQDDHGALISLHHARTLAHSMPFKLRAYSHQWLLERGLPSGLPDELKPRAERIYPRVVEAVGVSVRQLGNVVTPLTQAVECAMSNAAAECYADGERRPDIVKARMVEARHKAMAS